MKKLIILIISSILIITLTTIFVVIYQNNKSKELIAEEIAERNEEIKNHRLYYVGNLETKIYHTSDCDTIPNKSNTEYLVDCDEAFDKNYIPCQKCKPKEEYAQLEKAVEKGLNDALLIAFDIGSAEYEYPPKIQNIYDAIIEVEGSYYSANFADEIKAFKPKADEKQKIADSISVSKKIKFYRDEYGKYVQEVSQYKRYYSVSNYIKEYITK